MADRRKRLSADDETQMSVILRAKDNENEAWDTITKLYSPLIRHWAWKKGINCHHEQNNIIQQVFERVYHKLDTFSKPDGKGSFRGWLHRITDNLIFSNMRYQVRPQLVGGGSSWDHVIQNLAKDEPTLNSIFDSVSESGNLIESDLLFRRIMNWVRESHDPKQTKAFTRVVIDERPARDVAAELNISVNRVYQIKCRILKEIREVFKDIV